MLLLHWRSSTSGFLGLPSGTIPSVDRANDLPVASTISGVHVSGTLFPWELPSMASEAAGFVFVQEFCVSWLGVCILFYNYFVRYTNFPSR